MRSALPEARAAGGPLMCPRIVYVAPSGSPLVHGDCEVLVFLTWKATGSSTALCAAADAAVSVSSRAVQIRPTTTAARRRPHGRGPALHPFACSMITCARSIFPTFLALAREARLCRCCHSAAIVMLYQTHVFLSNEPGRQRQQRDAPRPDRSRPPADRDRGCGWADAAARSPGGRDLDDGDLHAFRRHARAAPRRTPGGIRAANGPRRAVGRERGPRRRPRWAR